MTKVGVTAWGQKTQNNNNNNNYGGEREELPKFPFMKLKNGKNILRIVTKPHRYEFAKASGPKSNSRFGDRINCAAPDVCPARAAGLYIGERFYVGVLDKSDSEVKVLDMSTLVYDGLTAILESLEDEHSRKVDPTEFDVNITYNKGAPAALTYKVVNRSIEPLSAENQELVDDKMDSLLKVLAVKSSYYKPETVQKRLDSIGWTKEYQADLDAKKREEAEAKKAKKEKKSDEGLKTSDDDDYSFDKPEESAAAAN